MAFGSVPNLAAARFLLFHHDHIFKLTVRHVVHVVCPDCSRVTSKPEEIKLLLSPSRCIRVLMPQQLS